MNSAWKAAATSAALTTLFFIVYPFCNWVASRRAHVASFYFHWEKLIPFVPIFIIPYASINLFFFAAPFIVRTERERIILVRRIVTAMFISAACFLLMPLRFAFARPPVSGFSGMLFDSLYAFDRPFNQFPSLHIAFCVILAATYLRRWCGPVRIVLTIWFVLVGLSTLFTYQHHVVDVFGGAAVAAFCLAVFRNPRSDQSASDSPGPGNSLS